MHDKSITETIEALRTGDRSAFERIYHRFGPKLCAFTRKLIHNREEADEIVQEVFLKVWERKHFLDPHQNLDGYLFTIARNLVYNKAKHQVHKLAYTKYLQKNKNIAVNSTEETIQYEDLNQLLEEAYMSLPPVRKQVFVMSRMEGLTNVEIAEKLQTSTSNIENHINKALRFIRSKLSMYKVIHVVLLFLSSLL